MQCFYRLKCAAVYKIIKIREPVKEKYYFGNENCLPKPRSNPALQP